MFKGLILVFITVPCVQCFTEELLTVNMLQELHTSHILILASNMYEDKNLVRRFSKLFIAISVLPKRRLAQLLNKPQAVPTLVSINGLSALTELLEEEQNKRLPSKVKWLVKTSETPEKLPFYIPMNCEIWLARKEMDDSYKLVTVFQVTPNTPLISYYYGTFKNNEGNIVLETVTTVRTNAHGAPFINLVPLENPCDFELVCIHYFIMADILRAVNFTRIDVSIKTLNTEFHGAYDGVGNLAAFHPTSNFEDMMGPVLTATMYMSLQDVYGTHADYWLSYMQPFGISVWACIGGWIVISSIVIATIYYIVEGKQILQYALSPLDSIANQGLNVTLPRFSIRCSLLMPRVLSAVLSPAYSAALIASLTVKLASLPFNDINEFVEDGTYKLGSLKMDTFSIIYFKSSAHKDMQEIASRLQLDPSELLLSYQENIQKICKDPKFVFVGYNSIIQKHHSPCKILRIPKPVTSAFTGLELARDSPHKKVLTFPLMKMGESGLLSRLDQVIKKEEPPPVFQAIEQQDVIMPCTLLITGIIISMFIYQIEVVYFFLRRKNKLEDKEVRRIRKIIPVNQKDLSRYTVQGFS